MERSAFPVTDPVLRAGDFWELLESGVPEDIVDPASWDRLAPAAAALPGPAFLLEREIGSPEVTQLGFSVPPWRMAAASASAATHRRAAFLGPHVDAWQSTANDLGAFGQLHAMWDEVGGDGEPLPQAFLTFLGAHSEWRAGLRAFADHLGESVFADAWRRCADAPHANVVGAGVYHGRADMPVRVTLSVTGERQWRDHPNWDAVDAIANLAGVPPLVAVAPTVDPGVTWHVPVIARMHPRPHEVLFPLADALEARGLVGADVAGTLQRPAVMIAVPGPVTLEGVPALLRLMVSIERIKVVVMEGEWISAKACYAVRPVWRNVAGRVLVET